MSTTYRRTEANFKIKIKMFLTLAFLLVFVTSAQAVLLRVGPNDEPSPPASGFPLWYQDTIGIALDLCIPETPAQDAACLAPPVPDPAQPIAFPTNWPDEAFWHVADATFDFDAAGTNSALLVQALEAAFGGGGAAVGDQIVFGRIRIRIDAPVNGNYTVTYPYGEQVFPGVIAGRKAINVTSDIGIGAPGDFTGALNSDIGPFLIPVTAPVVIDGSTFLSDGVTPAAVTGSPFGTNFFRVCVDNPAGLDGAGTLCMETPLFTVIGKVHQGAIGSPLSVDRATYARDAIAAQVDVFATSSPGPGAPVPILSVGDATGATMTSVLMSGPTAFGKFFGQGAPLDPTAIPAAVIVTNTADIPPSSLTQTVVDEVTITEASYDSVTGTMTITATSSDKLVPPQLFAIGLPGSAGSEALTSTANPADPAEQRLTAFAVGLVPSDPAMVISSAGGHDAEQISATEAVFQPGAPVATDDNVSVEAGTAAEVVIPVLANDTGADATTVQILSQGTNGTAVADPVSGDVTYSFTNTTFVGDDTFTYTVRSAPAPGGLESNVATVTVTTTTPVGGPVPLAGDDGPFNVQVNAVLPIPAAALIANDDPNTGVIDPTSIEIVAGSVTGGAATVAANGDVTYTAGAVAGDFSFQYTVANTIATGGQRSLPATASITVLPNTDVLGLTSARFRIGNQRWDVVGTSTVPAPNTVTLRLVQNGVVGAVIGTAPVGNLGGWVFRAIGSAVVAANGDSVQATSTAGGTTTLAVQVVN